MIQKLIFHAPCHQLSFGQVSFNLLREFYKRKMQIAYFPIGQPDFSAFKIDPQFGAWIEQATNNRYSRLDRKVPTLKLWHIRDGEARLSDKQCLFSFFECDATTETEIQLVNHQDHTFFCSNWTVDTFKTFGANNVSFVPLGWDEDFVPATHRIMPEEITHWVMCGKFEEFRKMTAIQLLAWLKKYGNNKKHQLTLCVTNPFYRKESHGFSTDDLLARVFAQVGGKPFNVTILPMLKTNAEMLRVYQSADVALSLSRGEAWNIPSFTMTALGKWAVVSNCSGHKDWATAENSVLVEPSGMVPANDGFFFRKGGDQFNQGNMYDFTPESIEAGLVELEKRAKTPNLAGEKLRETHTYTKTVEMILEKIGD